MRKNPIGWFEIYVDDLERAKLFYENVFDLKLQEMDETGHLKMYSFETDRSNYGSAGALVKLDCVKAGGNSTIVYFSCNDCKIEEKKAIENGGKVIHEKMSIAKYGYISLVTDSEGNIIGLHSLK